MSQILFEQYSAQFGEHFSLQAAQWSLDAGQQWVITGPNGAGKSALAACLSGAGERTGGQLSGLPERVAVVSFEAQGELIERELKKDDADILDVISEGTPVGEILQENCQNPERRAELIEAFGLGGLLDSGFRKLSTGETRKVMLIKALCSAPQLLVLDEPFDGLDAHSSARLQSLLQQLSGEVRMVFVLNRFDEIPDFVTHIAYVEAGRLAHCVAMDDVEAVQSVYQLLHLKTTDLSIPPREQAERPPALNPEDPLVRIRQARVAYGETVIFSDIDWSIRAGEHWQLTGPNGSGKTCLLNLITGDHPQCYVNDIFVFGMQRGSGESIWQIKQYIGYVSTKLQWEHRVSVSVRNVVISGFYDSIGLYQKYTDQQRKIADRWLALLGLSERADEPYNQLSFGDQRLLLIARAMVKHPTLLILDEPCLGLDDMNRQLVLALIEKICAGSESTVLYVNHHQQDKIAGIEHFLQLQSRD